MEEYLRPRPASPGKFQPPEGTEFVLIDRTTGQRITDPNSQNAVYELFVEGQAPSIGAAAATIGTTAYDLSDLPDRIEPAPSVTINNGGGAPVAVPAPPADLGDLGGGGLY
jgi:penicillin-binding protein 1A